MPTQKIVLKSIDEFLAGYNPIYRAIYPLFLGRSRRFNAEVGKMNFKSINTVGDIRAKHYTPKDTEMQLVAVAESSKVYKKYVFANRFEVSTLQDQEGVQDAQTQVLEEHQKQFDEVLFMGDDVAGVPTNNALYYSNDENYVLKNSDSIEAGSGRLNDLHETVITVAQEANEVAGTKLLMHYGTDLNKVWNGLYSSAVRPFKTVLQEVLGGDYNQIQLPNNVVPSGAMGFMIVNIDQIMMNYTLEPNIMAQGTNEEKMYHWFNFVFGSSMIDVKTKGAIIRQPLTLAT